MTTGTQKSNAQKAHENYQVFCEWASGKSLKDLIHYLQRRKNGDVMQHKLNRSKINSEIKIGNAINQHRLIRMDLELLEAQMLEGGLRDADVPVEQKTEDDEGVVITSPSIATPPGQGGLNADERRRLNELQEENAYLREELKKKTTKLKKHGLIESFLTDTTRWPR